VVKIPFVDLAAQHRQIRNEINVAVKRVINRGDFILGQDLELFEKDFAKFCQTKYAVGVSSGTAALFLALKSLGVGSTDEVIVPTFTYIASALAVSYTQAKPVLVDIEEDTYNIDVDKIERAITPRTKAVIAVHLYGQPANMEEVLKIAKQFNLKVIEDAAQAHGARLKIGNNWRLAGSLSDVGCFSFYPSKNLGALGDGGMLTTNHQDIYQKLLSLRDYGRVSKYEHVIIGYNSRLDTLQAAILRAKLQRLNQWNKMRRQAAKTYNQNLKGIPGLITPYCNPDVEHIYHVYALRTKQRDRLVNALKDNDIGAIIHYPIPVHLQKAYADLGYRRGDFPVSERVCQEILSLPMYPHIKENQIRFVCSAIRKILEH
jgi:dTDP-4-amino-4,6-dideoxygalactose transaminase